MKARQALTMMLIAALCGGCTILESKKIEYKSAGGKLPPLEVPPDLTRVGSDDRYTVPDISPTGTATYSAYSADRNDGPRIGGTDVLPDVTNVRVERTGNERWLVISDPPEKVWPVVKQFWQENGFLLKLEMPEAGILETDWAENRAAIPQDVIRNTIGKVFDSLWSTGERDKFRTRLERTAAGGTEIFISHRGMVEEFTADEKNTMWTPRPADPELEAEFLNRLMVRLGVAEQRAQTLLTSAQAAAPRASMVQGEDGAGVLALDEAFDRAWRRVGLALDRVGFTVEDRDRSKGLYYVRYVNPKTDTKSGGLLSKLAFWRDDDGPGKAAQYQVRVTEGSDASRVQVLNTEGQVETSNASAKILGLLYEQLK